MRLISFCASALLLISVPAIGFSQWSDECATATPLALDVGESFHSAFASLSPDVYPGCPNNNPDVWFSFVAGETRDYKVKTCGPGNTGQSWTVTILDNCGGTAISCRTYNCAFDDDIVPFSAVAGSTYRIRISSSTNGTGFVRVTHYDPPLNDDCSTALPIHSFGDFPFDLEQASMSPLDGPTCKTIHYDAWFQWIAPYSEPVIMSVDHDQAVVAVYGSCGGTELVCKRFTGQQERLTFVALSGESYWVRVAGYFAQTRPFGDLTIRRQEVLERPANAHAYFYEVDQHMNWDDARAYAQQWMLQGIAGHLVTLESAAEAQFLVNSYYVDFQLPWIGLVQDVNDPNFSEPGGGWKWITGEPLSFTDWLPPNRPDNSLAFGGMEDFGGLAQNGKWEDQRGDAPRKFFIEWDLDPVGTAFCGPADPNSVGLSTTLAAQNSGDSTTGVRLEAFNGPPSQFAYFVVGSNPSSTGTPFSQGRFCLEATAGSSLGRYNQNGGALYSVGRFNLQGRLTNISGTSSTGSGFDVPMSLPFPGLPMIQAGETWHFQLWHRENGGQSNFSNGLSVTF